MTNDDITYRRGQNDAIAGRSPQVGQPDAYYEGYRDGTDELELAA